MKERRSTVSRLTGLAEGVAASARRRQRDRAPRVLLYDADGHPATLPPDAPGFDDIVRAAGRMIELGDRAGGGAGEGEEEPAAQSSPLGVSVREPRTEGDSGMNERRKV